MTAAFAALIEEARRPEFKPWRGVLRHLATMHEGAMYENPASPAPYPQETIGAGYYFNPAGTGILSTLCWIPVLSCRSIPCASWKT